MAQTKDSSDIEFMTQKITTVYAGYRDKVKNNEFKNLVNRVKRSAIKDTFATLSNLTLFFNDHHLALYQRRKNTDIDTTLCKIDYENLSKSMYSSNAKDKYEGYWINELSSIVIYFKAYQNKEYRGYVVESKYNVPQGYCILKLEKGRGGKIVTDYIDIKNEFRTFTKSFFKSQSVFVGSSFSKWIKIQNYYPGILKERKEFDLKSRLLKIDSNCILLKMHDFSSVGISKFYDSVIKANAATIANCKTLIIDCRNNGGGGFKGFLSIVPFICTNPIIAISSQKLSSDDVIDSAQNDRRRFIDKNDSSMVTFYNNYINNLLEKKGEFLSPSHDTFPCNPVKSEIKNVGVIINHGCRSAAELMVLYLKQNSKVTLFGEHTAGALDYLSIMEYRLPNTHYRFWVGSSKRQITKHDQHYDNIGIKPDVEISDSIEMNDWVQFVKAYYEKN